MRKFCLQRFVPFNFVRNPLGGRGWGTCCEKERVQPPDRHSVFRTNTSEWLDVESTGTPRKILNEAFVIGPQASTTYLKPSRHLSSKWLSYTPFVILRTLVVIYLRRSICRNNPTKRPDFKVWVRLGHLYLELELDRNLHSNGRLD